MRINQRNAMRTVEKLCGDERFKLIGHSHAIGAARAWQKNELWHNRIGSSIRSVRSMFFFRNIPELFKNDTLIQLIIRMNHFAGTGRQVPTEAELRAKPGAFLYYYRDSYK